MNKMPGFLMAVVYRKLNSFYKPNPLKASQGLNKKIGYLQTQNLGTKIIHFFKFSKLQRKREKMQKS